MKTGQLLHAYVWSLGAFWPGLQVGGVGRRVGWRGVGWWFGLGCQARLGLPCELPPVAVVLLLTDVAAFSVDLLSLSLMFSLIP